MFITRQILNQKHRKLMRPHKRQILNQIKSSIDDQSWEISRQMSFMDDQQIKQKHKITRPKTALSTSHSMHRPYSNSINRYSNVQDIQKRSSSFMKKVNYQFKQIKQITSLFDNFFKIKKKKIKPEKIKFSQNVKLIKDKILKKEKQQIQNFQKIKRQKFSKVNQNSGNQYLGYPKEKIKKVIPVSKAKNEDINKIATCIKGGYVEESKQFSDLVNKEEIIKLKRNFITMDTLYESVKGKKNKGISEIKPQTVDRSSMKNMVYFLQNEKHLKFSEKMAIQEKLKLIS